MSTLYIAEKPSQGKDIARNVGAVKREEGYFSGDGVKVTWCLGHLLEQAPPDEYCKDIKPWRMDVLPVIPDRWKLRVKEKTRKQFTIIQRLLKEAGEVVIATDADREGDVIGREILDYCRYQGKVQRLWLSALDDTSIQKALAAIRPGASTEPLYQAGLGRQRADWLIGMNMTMAASCLFSRGKKSGVLSVGRVQTPTLNLVVARDREIEDFIPKDYFELDGTFSEGGTALIAKWQPSEAFKEAYGDDAGRCLNQAVIDALKVRLTGQPATVTTFTDKPKRTAPPECFSLSSLQKLASARFGFSAAKTLNVAQALYEKHKATTYPRTDTGHLPEEQLAEVPQVLNALKKICPEFYELISQCNPDHRSRIWNTQKVTAHHGIIPTTNPGVSPEQMSQEERQLYEVICRYYLAQFLGDYTYSQRSVTLTCEEEVFTARSNTPLSPGWKQALNTTDEEENEAKEEETTGVIPVLTPGQGLLVTAMTIQEKQTKAPARYTEGTLITAMKNIARLIEDPAYKKILKNTSGIGTEATRANIIETLIARKYLSRKKKQLVSTASGRRLIDLLPAQIKNPATTASWESELEKIAGNELSLASFLQDQEETLEFMLDDLAEAAS